MLHQTIRIQSRTEPEAGDVYPVSALRLKRAKRGFATRRVDMGRIAGIAAAPDRLRPGDLVLARVTGLGQHRRIELPSGRRAHLHPGDEIIVAFGNRYASDQFEAVMPERLEPCHLVAAGGIASRAVSLNAAMKSPTRIDPVGLLTDAERRPLNLVDFALAPRLSGQERPPVCAVVGTSMNAGKTTTVSGLVRGATRCGYRVGVAKVTGTGAGGDMWSYLDSGAAEVLDFTDAGFATTHRLDPQAIGGIFRTLVAELTAREVDLIMVEVADGLLLDETADLVRSPLFRQQVDSVVLSAACSMSADSGLAWMAREAIPVAAISGKVTAAPLAARELGHLFDGRVLSLEDLEEGRWLPHDSPHAGHVR